MSVTNNQSGRPRSNLVNSTTTRYPCTLQRYAGLIEKSDYDAIVSSTPRNLLKFPEYTRYMFEIYQQEKATCKGDNCGEIVAKKAYDIHVKNPTRKFFSRFGGCYFDDADQMIWVLLDDESNFTNDFDDLNQFCEFVFQYAKDHDPDRRSHRITIISSDENGNVTKKRKKILNIVQFPHKLNNDSDINDFTTLYDAAVPDSTNCETLRIDVNAKISKMVVEGKADIIDIIIYVMKYHKGLTNKSTVTVLNQFVTKTENNARLFSESDISNRLTLFHDLLACKLAAYR